MPDLDQQMEAEAALHVAMRLKTFDDPARARILVMAAINLDMLPVEQLVGLLGSLLRRKKPVGVAR